MPGQDATENLSCIFISYHRSDSEADAGRLGDTLRQRLGDDRVFTDVTTIEFGANWERIVDRALANSVAVLLPLGPARKPTDPILYEVRAALRSRVSVIPILLKDADWAGLMEQFPVELQVLQKLNAHSLDHASWHIDVEPLIGLVEKMLADPARTSVVYKPSEPGALLTSCLDKTNVRSLLVHAADLAECLDDASVLAEAQQVVGRSLPDSLTSSAQQSAPSELTYLLGNARYRLMVEQIGRDLLTHSTATGIGQYLQDPALDEQVRRHWESFESEEERMAYHPWRRRRSRVSSS